ncbi:hypothetical protein AGLY_004681 [Aphis glycines]|uniref:Uncharacterized protein n=1 Tax=Aphis glycines TaxID=307491 RepID=A0A6G0TWW2_APHGL|nr:hypothetical protein AGLY_004681 [Aphis glycines]
MDNFIVFELIMVLLLRILSQTVLRQRKLKTLTQNKHLLNLHYIFLPRPILVFQQIFQLIVSLNSWIISEVLYSGYKKTTGHTRKSPIKCTGFTKPGTLGSNIVNSLIGPPMVFSFFHLRNFLIILNILKILSSLNYKLFKFTLDLKASFFIFITLSSPGTSSKYLSQNPSWYDNIANLYLRHLKLKFPSSLCLVANSSGVLSSGSYRRFCKPSTKGDGWSSGSGGLVIKNGLSIKLSKSLSRRLASSARSSSVIGCLESPVPLKTNNIDKITKYIT